MSTMENIDIQLIKKYDRPGPRYTSYPPAPAFSSSFTADDFLQSLKENNSPENKAEMSLYFHIPFCDTLCYFCGCNMLVTRSRPRIAEYLDYLKNEMKLGPIFQQGQKSRTASLGRRNAVLFESR